MLINLAGRCLPEGLEGWVGECLFQCHLRKPAAEWDVLQIRRQFLEKADVLWLAGQLGTAHPDRGVYFFRLC